MDGRSDEHTPALFIFLVFLPFKTQTICSLLPENQTGLQGGEERKKKTVHQEAEMERGRKSDTNPNWLFDWEIICLVKVGWLSSRSGHN